MLYPQIRISLINPINPGGCWDYTAYNSAYEGRDGIAYATKEGSQVSILFEMVRSITGINLERRFTKEQD